MTGQPNDYEHRAEGESTFEWPLDSAGMRMSADELLDSLLATIQHLNHTDAWPLTILPPRFGDVLVDRERRGWPSPPYCSRWWPIRRTSQRCP